MKSELVGDNYGTLTNNEVLVYVVKDKNTAAIYISFGFQISF